ncbi:MAG: thiamine-phosphate kinase [Cytophagales bacterium]|nr:thiamine-phosphate kinase [Cytophagales bacterium]
MSDEKRTEISDLGEFGLIEKINESARAELTTTIKGIGDDASVHDAGDKYILISTDLLIEGVHFDLAYMPIQHLGFKAIAVNISDIVAMNGTPKQMTVSLALSNRFSAEAVQVFYEGVKAACEKYNVDLVGGDTTASPSGLMISVTAMGECDKEKIVYRSGAKENDILCVSGDFGGALVGLQVLEREKQEFLANPEMQPKLDDYEYIVGRQLRPQARLDIVHELAQVGVVPTSMIDVSDGLTSDLFHICKQSDVGFSIYEDKLPIDKQTFETAAEFSMDPNACALNGGEDYELAFTVKQEDFDKIEKFEDISSIGYMHSKEKGRVLVTSGNQIIELEAKGWKHF